MGLGEGKGKITPATHVVAGGGNIRPLSKHTVGREANKTSLSAVRKKRKAAKKAKKQSRKK